MKMELKSNYCQACLSNDRRLYPLMQMQSLLHELNISEMNVVTGGICWECRSIMMRFTRFKAQVLQAQNMLCQCDKVSITSCGSWFQMLDTRLDFDLLHTKIQGACLCATVSAHYQLQDLKCLSKLSYHTNCYYNYKFSHKRDGFNNPKDINIKEEIDDTIDIYEEHLHNSDDEKQYFSEIEDKVNDINELFNDCEEKPLASDVYVEILNSEMKINLNEIRRAAPKSFTRSLLKNIEDEDTDKEEIRKKFTTVVFTEEEMLRNREEKRNQPNFKKIPYKCDSCVLGFTRKDTYDVHMEKKHSENIGDHLCPVCKIRFPSEKQAEIHTRKHYVSYRCCLCKYVSTELWSAFSHCRVKHQADSNDSIHCPYCAIVGKTPEELSQHIASEHGVVCNECGEKFKGLSTLKAHKRRIHGVKREFTCEHCSKTFKRKSRLESHIVSHGAALAQALAYCAPCRVQYKDIYVYRNHLRTSANHAERAYQCRDCNKKFASKVYLKKHYNFYHLHKSQFRCEMCDKLFISECRLKSHRQTQHGLSRSRDHACNVCGKQFFTLSTLKGHQLTHSEQRTFMCEDCGDTFKQRAALYTHYKLVHKGMKRRKKI